MEDHDLIEELNVGPSNNEEKSLATFSHLGFLASGIFPMGNIILPLVIWLIKKEESDYINEHGKQALNFQLSITIMAIGAAFLTLIGIGVVMLLVLAVVDVVYSIKAAIRANRGEYFEYPLNFKIIK